MKGSTMAKGSLVKVAIITGYLGAGKTTLLNHILTNAEGIRAAVIVNDIGEVNIDAELIAKTGAVTQMDDSLIPMTNGCICCSLSEDLSNQLNDLANSGNFDYIVIEASGVCEPMPIAYTIQAFCQAGEEDDAPMLLDNVISVVDCARLLDEFNSGRDLLDGEDDIVQLLVEQIEFCSTLVLNKTDLVTDEQVAEIRAIVRSLQKKAVIVEAENGQVDLDELLNTGRFDFEHVFDSVGWVSAMDEADAEAREREEHEHEHEHHHDHDHDHHGHHHHHHHDDDEECDDPECHCHHHHHGHDHDHVAEFGISTFVYQRRRPFRENALDEMVEDWPKGILRCKGMVWLSEDSDMCYVFEQAGHRFSLGENGLWLATADEEYLAQLAETEPDALKGWDDEVGDREIKLVFITRGADQDAIEQWADSFLA